MADQNRFGANGRPATAPQAAHPWNPVSPNGSSASSVAPQHVPTQPATAPEAPTSMLPPATVIPATQGMSVVPGTGAPPAVQHEGDYWRTPQGVAYRYRAYEANRADALLASIGLLNAGLMDIASALQAAIGTSLAASKAPVKRMHKLLPLIDAELRVIRQVERLSVLERTLPRRTDFG